MELSSGRPLTLEPPLGARRRRWPGTHPYCDTDGVDRISGLPDDLLYQVLVRLRCARAAGRTSLLSRRWRGLWRHLPELSFREIAPGALDTALSQISRTELYLLDINVPNHHRYSAAGVASLLRAAARLAPVVLRLVVCGDIYDRDIPVEVPIFHRATSIELDAHNLYLTPPVQGCEFPVLERLSISGCHFDNGFLVPQCPCLRVLELCHCWHLGIVMVHSATIEELVVSHNGWIGGIDIVAPALKKFTMSTYMGRDFNVSFFAPIVKDLSWRCLCDSRNVGIGDMWRLRELDLLMEQSVYNLDLTIEMPDIPPNADRDLMKQIAQLPKFSVLGLYLLTWGHVFGAMVLNLLGICTTIQSLKLVIEPLAATDEACPPNCPCDQLHDWRNQNISLKALEEVAIKNVEGSGHEVDFVKLLFRCAPLIKRMTVKLAPKVLPSNRGCKEICNIFKANPSVKCYLYSSRDERVVYA
ncbi:unnamed protein product [Urochloa decumbens]|uniref:F-box domain-containing protein n=1 Tax=Urochloa decumbens TaxID=240449 RepID=A0ABC9ESW1_9POAL